MGVPNQARSTKGPARPLDKARGVLANSTPMPTPFVLTERQLAAKAALSERIPSPRGGMGEKGHEELLTGK